MVVQIESGTDLQLSELTDRIQAVIENRKRRFGPRAEQGYEELPEITKPKAQDRAKRDRQPTPVEYIRSTLKAMPAENQQNSEGRRLYREEYSQMLEFAASQKINIPSFLKINPNLITVASLPEADYADFTAPCRELLETRLARLRNYLETEIKRTPALIKQTALKSREFLRMYRQFLDQRQASPNLPAVLAKRMPKDFLGFVNRLIELEHFFEVTETRATEKINLPFKSQPNATPDMINMESDRRRNELELAQLSQYQSISMWRALERDLNRIFAIMSQMNTEDEHSTSSTPIVLEERYLGKADLYEPKNDLDHARVATTEFRFRETTLNLRAKAIFYQLPPQANIPPAVKRLLKASLKPQELSLNKLLSNRISQRMAAAERLVKEQERIFGESFVNSRRPLFEISQRMYDIETAIKAFGLTESHPKILSQLKSISGLDLALRAAKSPFEETEDGLQIAKFNWVAILEKLPEISQALAMIEDQINTLANPEAVGILASQLKELYRKAEPILKKLDYTYSQERKAVSLGRDDHGIKILREFAVFLKGEVGSETDIRALTNFEQESKRFKIALTIQQLQGPIETYHALVEFIQKHIPPSQIVELVSMAEETIIMDYNKAHQSDKDPLPPETELAKIRLQAFHQVLKDIEERQLEAEPEATTPNQPGLEA